MKRVIMSLLAVVLCLSTICPAFAASFVPSAGYKPAPEIVGKPDEDGRVVIGVVTDVNGNILSTEYEDCIVITPVGEVDTSTRIPKDAAELLKDVYEEFTTGGKKLSDACPELNDVVKEALGAGKTADDLVIKDMFDVTALCDELKTNLAPKGNTIDLVFDIGIAPGTFVQVMAYIDGRWQLIEKTINNGDGTITCTFEELCPIAILVPADTVAGGGVTPNTGDANGTQIVTWSVIAGISLLAIMIVMIVYRRKMVK